MEENMAIKMELIELPTPLLEFGGPGEFSDPKVGLLEAGPFDLRFGAAHQEQIRVGLVGPAQMIEQAKAWLERCQGWLPSGMKNNAQYPSYPGFQKVFHASLIVNEHWIVTLNSGKDALNEALAIENPYRRFKRVLELYAGGVEKLADLELARPDVVMCCLSNEVVKKCWSIRNELTAKEVAAAQNLRKQDSAVQLSLFNELQFEEQEEDLLFRDFRRALKARVMRFRMPIQIGTSQLFVDSDKSQDPATRAWNSTVALYYKAGGIPWRLKIEGPKTCFVGISFHHLRTTQRHLVCSSIAQAFSTEGEGFAIRGESVPWEAGQGRNVHLTSEQAHKLGLTILAEYYNRTGGAPLRIVLHKTSDFNDAEEKGFCSALSSVPIVELINILPTQFRLVRYGIYPPKRGMLCLIGGEGAYLFTTGFIPEFSTYPGPHIPTPVRIKSSTSIDLKRAASDILGLTRMNWNTASITTGQPVTLSFARKIGGVMAEFGEGRGLQSSFKYYI